MTETGLLKNWPEQGPKLLWTAQALGHGFASVTIAEGRIYTAGDIGELNVITAMDLHGRIQWQVNNGAAWTKPSRVALGVALRVDSFRSSASRKGKVR